MSTCAVFAQEGTNNSPLILEFGEGGATQMVYDRRQRPQTLFYKGMVYIVYRGGADLGREKGTGKKPTTDTFPYIVSYNPKTKKLSKPIKLSETGGRDQHFTPVIWIDNADHIHVLFGCHNDKSENTHLVTKKPGDIGTSAADWKKLPQIRKSMSYPSVYNISRNRQVVYFRAEGHASRWMYSISGDNGKTWKHSPTSVTDLNAADDRRLKKNTSKEEARGIDESSSYHSVCPSSDGKYLHVAFSWYEDNKRNNKEKFWNPRYKTNSNLGFKFNLYYVKINLDNHEVRNYQGDLLKTPMKLDYVNRHCMIWDTDWRGSGKPPFVNIDKNGDPTFIHCLSSDTDLTKFNFWYVRRDEDKWKKSVITPTNHSWQSCYSKTRNDGLLRAFLVRSTLENLPGWMCKRGGGNLIEEWVSKDNGNAWTKTGSLSPKDPKYKGWRFNCIQPVRDRDGNDIEGLHVCYGWKGDQMNAAKAFIVDAQ